MRAFWTLLLALLAAGCLGGGDPPGPVPDPCAPAPGAPTPTPGGPVADAGPDYDVRPGDAVFLDGTGSFDPRGRPLTYAWAQLSGPCVPLDLKDPARPVFQVPRGAEPGTTFVFRLVVTAGGEASHPDEADAIVVA